MTRIVIVGAGAMGCLFAARLRGAGATVQLVDVNIGRMSAIAANGITLVDRRGTRTVPVATAVASDAAGPADLVIFLTKSMHTAAAAGSVAHLAGDGTFALTVQNGLGNAEAIAETFGAGRTLMGATDFPAVLEDDHRVSSPGDGHVWLGCLDDGAAGREAAAATVALFDAAGMDAMIMDGVAAILWEKAAFNAVLNAIAMIGGLRVGQIDGEAGWWIAHHVVDEVVAAAVANQVGVDRSRLLDKIRFALANHRDHRPSMLQDRLAKRPTEIEAINGALMRAGEGRGVPMPVTATLANLVRLIERAER